jgi:hypothetical protein
MLIVESVSIALPLPQFVVDVDYFDESAAVVSQSKSRTISNPANFHPRGRATLVRGLSTSVTQLSTRPPYECTFLHAPGNLADIFQTRARAALYPVHGQSINKTEQSEELYISYTPECHMQCIFVRDARSAARTYFLSHF